MRKTLIIWLLFICFSCFSQTHVEYISEKTDSMALINKEDIDIINNVFIERNVLDSLYQIDERIISALENKIIVKDSIIVDQNLIIDNHKVILSEMELENENLTKTYNKKLRQEKNKKISFQALSGAGIIVIILLILL